MAGELEVVNWITDIYGQWFDPNNSTDEVDIDNMGNGINQPNDVLRLERKVVFSDSSAAGDPLLADDAMVWQYAN